MKKGINIRRVSALIICFALLLSSFAFAADEEPVTPPSGVQVNKTGGWTDVGADRITLSKVVEGTENENYFNIDLTVTTETNVKDVVENPSIAVVIVMDGSNTMKTYNIDGTKHEKENADKTTRVEAAISSSQYFIDLFSKASAETQADRKVGFVVFDSDAHKGFDLTQCRTEEDAAEIKSAISASAHASIDVLDMTRESRRWTNIEAGLKMAKDMLDAETDIQNEYKFIVFLSDGFPTTYCMTEDGYTGYDVYMRKDNSFLNENGYVIDDTHTQIIPLPGNGADGVFYNYKKNIVCFDGNNYSDRAAQRAEDMACVIKNSGIGIYSVGVGFYNQSVDAAGGDSGYLIDCFEEGDYVIGNNEDSFKNWLGGTDNSGIGSGFYADALSENELTKAFGNIFAEIRNSSESAANASWLASDPIPEGFDFMGFYGNNNETLSGELNGENAENKENTAVYSGKIITWDLKKSGYTKTVSQSADTETTVYTYHLKYALRLRNEEESFISKKELATNGRTTLRYTVRETENDREIVSEIRTADFLIPSVEGYLAEFSFNKVDQLGRPVTGAGFTLSHADGCQVGIEDKVVYSDEITGVVTFSGIASGHVYTLTETDIPGYVIDRNAGTYKVTVAYGEITIEGVPGEDCIVPEWNGSVVNKVNVPEPPVNPPYEPKPIHDPDPVDPPVNPPVDPPVDPPVNPPVDPADPPVEPPKEDEPVTDIPEEDVPKTDAPETELPEGEETDISDEDVPLADVPQTGDTAVIYLTAAAAVLGALIICFRKKED